jgi:hypothetical protein
MNRVQITSANRAAGDLDKRFTRLQVGQGEFSHLERFAWSVKNQGLRGRAGA